MKAGGARCDSGTRYVVNSFGLKLRRAVPNSDREYARNRILKHPATLVKRWYGRRWSVIDGADVLS